MKRGGIPLLFHPSSFLLHPFNQRFHRNGPDGVVDGLADENGSGTLADGVLSGRLGEAWL